jgi:hypothetical protein
MKDLLIYLQRNTFENKVNNIIFDLDEESLSLLDEDFVNQINENKIFSVDRLIIDCFHNNDIITEEKYYDKTYKHKSRGNRTIWTSNDGDELKIGDHANQRKDRPVEKGGDGGEPIKQYEIVNMFRWAWDDIMEMDLDGKLEPFEYKQRMVDAWTIECQCWLNTDKDKVVYGGARKRDMNLWAVWLLEQNGKKSDITIKTIFRGERMNHVAVQERIRIKANGHVEQRYKKID